MKKILLVITLFFLGACSQSGIAESTEYTDSPSVNVPENNISAQIIPGVSFRIVGVDVYYSYLYFEIENITYRSIPSFYADYDLSCGYSVYKSGTIYSSYLWEYDSERHSIYIGTYVSSCRLTITAIRSSEYGSATWQGSYTVSSW